MKNIILEFTLNGKKHTYLRRIDFYGEPIVTRIKENARKFDNTQIKYLISKLILKYGKNNIKDFNIIKG